MNRVLRNRIADNMVNLRKKEKISQVKLANLSGVSLGFIKGLETKRYNPSLDTLNKIAGALRVDIKELL